MRCRAITQNTINEQPHFWNADLLLFYCMFFAELLQNAYLLRTFITQDYVIIALGLKAHSLKSLNVQNQVFYEYYNNMPLLRLDKSVRAVVVWSLECHGHSECHEECFETKTATFELSELFLFFSSAQQLIFDNGFFSNLSGQRRNDETTGIWSKWQTQRWSCRRSARKWTAGWRWSDQ